MSFLTTELPQYALVIAAAGLRPEVVHICAAMTYTLLVLLAAYVARGRSTGVEAVVRALVALVIILAPEPGAASWVLLSDPDHVGTGVLLLLLLLLLDRTRASWSVPAAAFALLTWASVGDPLVEVVGALPLAVVCLARVALGLVRRRGTIRTLWYEASLAAAALLSVLAARAVAPADPGPRRIPDQPGHHRAHPARRGAGQRAAGHSQRAGGVRRRFPGAPARRPGDQPRVRGRAPGGAGARPRGGRGGGVGTDRVAGLAGPPAPTDPRTRARTPARTDGRSRPAPTGGPTASPSATWCQT